MPLYSSSTVVAARESHIENKRERRRRRDIQKSEEGIEHFSLITPTSSNDDII